MQQNRREFLKGTAWMGAVAMAAGCASNPLKIFGTTGAPMQGFALKPMKKVRVACVGVMIPGTEVTAGADLFQDRVDGEVKWLKEHNKPAPKIAVAGREGYKRICDSDEVDVIYNVTPWYEHTPIALYAMEHGKVILNEVPGVLTIDEGWELVETSEKTRIPCMMLENCCYGEEEMLMLNMVKQGVLGEITHGEAAYIHASIRRMALVPSPSTWTSTGATTSTSSCPWNLSRRATGTTQGSFSPTGGATSMLR